MTPSLSFLRWPKCAQRRLCGSIMFVKFSCALISDLSQKISFFFPVSDKISGKQSPSFCRERKLFGTGLFSNKLCLISWSEMRFKSLPIFQFFTKFSFILFRWTLGGEPWWGMLILGNFILWRFLMMSHCQYLSPLSLSDSLDDELYFLFLDPLFFFLGESCPLFFWTSLFSPRHCYDTCYVKFYQLAGFLMEPSQLE